MNTEYILSQMGYRPDRGFWVKPVGTSLFVFDAGTQEWSNHFLAMNGEHAVWDRHILPGYVSTDYEFFRRLKELEAFTRINVAWEAQADFRVKPDFSVVDFGYTPTGFPEASPRQPFEP